MNYLVVLVAAIAYMILGALWYSPVLFGNPWMTGLAKTPEQIKQEFSPLSYLWAFIFSFIAAYGIARMSYWAAADSMTMTVKIALLAGTTFVFATMGVNDVFESKSRAVSVINILYHVAGFLIMGVIIGAWR